MSHKRPPYPPAFRAQLVALVRAGRTPEEVAREFERERYENELAVMDDDDLDFQNPAGIAEPARQFDAIKELLTANTLSTS